MSYMSSIALEECRKTRRQAVGRVRFAHSARRYSSESSGSVRVNPADRRAIQAKSYRYQLEVRCGYAKCACARLLRRGLETVWQIVDRDLPPLNEAMRGLLAEIPD